MKDKLAVPYEDFMPKTTWELVWFVIKPYRLKFIIFLLLTTLGVLAWNATPYTISLIVNRLVETPEITGAIWVLVGIYAALRFADEILWRGADWHVRNFKPNMVETVRVTLFKQTLKRGRNYFVNSSSGRIGHWINQSTETTNEIFDNFFWSVWGSIMHMVAATIFLFTAHWSLAILFGVWLVLLFWFNIKRGRRFAYLVGLTSDERSKISGRVVDVITNQESVRVNNTAISEVEFLNQEQTKIVAGARRSWMHNLITNIIKGNSSVIVSIVAVVLILNLFANGQVEIGSIILFVAYFDSAAMNLWELAWALDGMYRQFGTIQNALDGLNAEDERTGAVVSGEKLPKKVELKLDNLNFAYPDQPEEYVLKDLNITISAGQKVGVVGHSGAGKSTLVGLLLGFYEPTAGAIQVNDIRVAEKDPSFMRSVSSFVPQDTSLFNRTIRENVAYSKSGATEKEVIKALKLAEAYDFVMKLPEGLDTLIGERGVKLSGGQRQRVAIARAILKDAPLLLLDEATSALDSVSEQAIQKALHTLMKDRTAVVIAHRLSTLKHLDRIIVIEDGEVVEDGSHEELLKKKHIYADLWARQKDGFISD